MRTSLNQISGAYIARLNLSESHLLGVYDKIKSQIAALSCSVRLIDLFYPSGGGISKNDKLLKKYGKGKFIRRLNYYFLFYYFLAKNPPSVDFFYIRYQRCSPFFLYMLYRFKKNNPESIIFIELPSYPYFSENTSLKGQVFRFIDVLTRPFLKKYVDNIVTFSHAENIFGISTIQTDNGVDVEKINPIDELIQERPLRLLGLANLSFWHGYDRVISGLANYYSNHPSRKVVFDIVGSGQEMARLQNDAKNYGLCDYVVFHGSMHGQRLNEIINCCHVGISSIGMHRLKVDTSNLKSREFCARGLPFVIAYDDNDFGKELPFVFHAPSNDDPLDIHSLVEFYDILLKDCPGFRVKMRSYAFQRLTWKAKLEPVLLALRERLV